MSSESSLKLNSEEEDQMDGSAESQPGEFSEELLKSFECPVCFKYMTSSIHNCLSGHSICSSCMHKGVSRCPICRVGLSSARNYMAEGMAKHIFFPCENEDRGCNMRVLGSEISQHQVNCSQRIYKCRMVCAWTGGRAQLIEHYTDAHPKNIFSSTSFNFTWHSSFSGVKYYCLMCAYGELFLWYGCGDPNKRCITSCVHYVGDAEKASMFTYTVTLKSEDGRRSLCYTDVTKNDSSDLDTTLPSIELFFASEDIYTKFSDKDGKVILNTLISKKA